MLICFVDTETTGLDPKVNRLVEIAVALWKFESTSNRIVRSFSTLCNDDTGIQMTPEITKINGVTQELLDHRGVPHGSVLKHIGDNYVKACDYLCAHNAPFDRAFIESELERANLPKWDKTWIDTKLDLPFPDNFTSRRLNHLAAEHGFLNPFPHTALADTMTMARIMAEYSIDFIIKSTEAEIFHLTMQTDYQDYETREKLKRLGFHWDKPNKIWKRIVKSHSMDKELAKCKAQGLEPKVSPA